jgi:phospholipase C
MPNNTLRFPTRRRFLTRAAQAASVAAASTLMPPNVQKLLAAGIAPPRSLKDVKHVVLLMQENRSFDHYFGTLSGVRGFNDPNAMLLPSGKSVFHQPDEHSPDGYMLPFHLDTKTTNAQSMPSTSHAWPVQHRAWNGGKMDQWLPAHRAVDGENGPYTMGYFTREDIPFHYALADAFTICDAYHSSVMGPTRPNRLYWMSAMIDPEGRYGGTVIKNAEITEGSKHWTTYPERLEAAGISWKFYQHAKSDFGFNMLHGFRNFADAPKNSSLAQRGLSIVSDGQFEYDALHDQLPTVSWLGPTNEASEHPDHMPAAGADFIARKLNAIAANPDVWAKTIFIINYDENDGLFDHVAPPVPSKGEPLEFIDGLPIGGGFRVPCIIVSPWTVGGWVCSQPFDHTSVLQFLEKFTGVREPNITDWRRRTFGDLTSAFRFGDMPAAAPRMPETATQLDRARYASANLPAPALKGTAQALPEQEKGTRKRVADRAQD